MKTWVRKSLSVGILAAAALLFAPGAANATARPVPAADTTAALGSSQSYSPITVPVTLSGTSLGNLGGSNITVNAGGLTESAKTTEHARVSPAVAGGHGNDNDFCDTSLRFLGGGQSFDGFRGHRGHGHWHGGVFLGDSFNGFNDVDFNDDDLVGDDLFLGDIDDSDDGGQFLGDQGSQDLLPTKPIKGNGSNDGYGNTAPATGNTAPATGNGNVAPTTVPGTNDGYGNAAPTTGNGNVSPATGGYGDVSPATGDTPAMGDTPTTGDTPTAGDTPSMGDTPAAGDTPVIGEVPPTKPIKSTKPVKHHHKPAVKPIKGNGDTTGPAVSPIKGNGDTTGPAVKPIKGNGDTTGYGDVSPATGSDTATDGGR